MQQAHRNSVMCICVLKTGNCAIPFSISATEILHDISSACSTRNNAPHACEHCSGDFVLYRGDLYSRAMEFNVIIQHLISIILSISPLGI